MPTNITIRKKTSNTPANTPLPQDNKKWGEWGKVDAQYSTDVTVDVMLDTGVYLRRVPVASKEWFIPDVDSERGFNSGERDLPPINARVFVFMPSYTYDDCFIAPFSGIFTFKKDEAAPFKEEEKEKIKERIMPNGWHITDDYVTGSHKAVSPDEKTILEIDYGTEDEPKEESPELHLNIFDNIKADIIAEDNVSLSVFDEVKIGHVKGESCTLKIFDTELVIEPGKVSVKPKETEIEVDGNATIKTSGKTDIEATGDVNVKAGGNAKVEATANINVKGVNATVTATALLTLKSGDATTWMPNITPVCPFGFPHGGPGAGIVKLKGG